MNDKNKINIVMSASAQGVKEAAAKAQKGLSGAFLKSKDAVAAFNKETGRGKKTISNLGGAVKGLLAGFIGFQTIRKATEIMKDAGSAAYNMQTSVAAANREFDNVGSVEDWENTIKDLSKELRIYSDTSLKNAVSRTVDMTKRLGLSAEQMKVVIKRSADLGAGKTDLEGAIERVTAALRGEAESSEYLGLTLNENYVKAVYEADKANTKLWKNLTDVEKAQARYNVFLQQSEEFQGRAAGSADTLAGAMAEIKKEIINAVSNSDDLETAMLNVSAVIRQNAGDIGKLISSLVTIAARIVEFAVEWRKLLIILASTVTSIVVLGKLGMALKGINAAFVVMTGSGILPWLKNLRVGLNAVAGQAALAGTALKLGLAAAAAWGVLKIVELIKAIYEWRKASAVAKKAQDELIANSDRYIRKFEEFKDVKLPGDITELAREDLEKLRKDLAKARAYYVALKAKFEEKGDTKGLKDVEARLKEINEDYKRVGEAVSSAAEEMEKPTEAQKALNEQVEDFEKQAKKAYEEAKKQAADYAQQVIEWEDKIKYAKLSTEDKIRELQRQGLTDAQKWNDQKLQADQKLYDARAALQKGDYELAEKLAKDAESLYAGLAKEVKGSDAGSDVVERSLRDTKEVAINGVTEVGNFVQELYTQQKDAAQNASEEWTATADGIKQQLDEITKQREANIEIKLERLTEAQEHINNLVRDETKHITIITHHVEAKRTGGMAGAVRAATGRHLPGYGGGDRIRAILEAGEFVVRKEAVKKYGAGLFHALNAMQINAVGAVKSSIGGMISNISIPAPRIAYQTGGPVAGLPGNETFTLRLQAGNMEAPLTVLGNKQTVRQMVKDIEKELGRMILSKK